MKISPLRIAFSALASLAMATSANAAPILDFSQSSPGNTVVSDNTGNNTTFSTSVPTQVLVGAVAGVPAPPNTLYTETFSFTSNQAPVGSGGNITQGGFSGTFTYTNTLTGVVQVAGSVQNATLSTITNGPGGTTATFNASNVTFTTIAGPILTQAGLPANVGLLNGTYSLTLNNLNPNITTSLDFSGRAAGIITAQVAVPEPASVVMTSMALVAGFGGLGLRRIKASRA